MILPSEGADRIDSHTPSLLDLLIRAGLVGAMAVLCYKVFSPFLDLMTWAVILAVALYPAHRRLARKIGDRKGLTSVLLVTLCAILLLAPTAILVNSVGDSVRAGVQAVEENTVKIPAPPAGLQKWPLVGPRIHAAWSHAYSDLPGFVRSMHPKLADLETKALSAVASIGIGLLMLLASLVVAGIVMAYGEGAARSTRAIFVRIAGLSWADRMVRLCTATIRTVAQGVLGVAFIQAMILGLILMIADVPWAGILSVLALVVGIAQLPTILVTLPAIAYFWLGGHHDSTMAFIYTVLILFAGLIDNILKPFVLGRGVDAPMPVILLGSLGGLASDGILGMFVGAVVLALGYRIFTGWVEESPSPPESLAPEASAPPS